jgi:hypothetical protein
MDKIKTVKIKNLDGSISEESYTISVDAEDVDMANGKELQETIGTIDIDTDGNIAEQLKNLNNNINNINNNINDLNIDIKKKAYFFNTVADMKNANLKVGDYACTLGYYKVNDGGAAEYKILNSSDSYYEKLENNLKAELITDDKINIDQFGAKGDGVTDDYVTFINAISYCTNNNKILATSKNKTYKTNSTLQISCNVEFNGTINGNIEFSFMQDRVHYINNVIGSVILRG